MKRIKLSLPAPYVGLRPFTENESLLFFGREPQVRELLAKLERRQRFTAVLGASGSGKSSLVRAGLIPALHRGALHAPAGSDASPPCRWNICTFQPGDAPLANLANALSEDPRWADNREHAAALSSLAAMLGTSPLALAELYRQKADAFEGQSLLLVVDQFEEIFRYRQRNPDEADSFVALLLRSASEALPIYVVITMRSDFLGNCVTFHGFPEAINSGIYLTPRLAVEQIKSVIVSPLTLAGGSIDPVLANRMLNALSGDDELPILQHALLCMWQRASSQGRSEIDADDFNAICAPRQDSLGTAEGGTGPSLSNAIDNHASAIHASLSAARRRIARQVLLSLVERHEGRDVRRPQTLHELRQLLPGSEHDDLHAVLDAFRAESAGFVLPRAGRAIGDDDLIDISHESLFRQWQLFRDWLDEEDLDVSELREWQRRATRWEKEGGDLLDDNDRRRAERWRTRVQSRAHPETWATRYEGPGAYALVDAYIQGSLEWHIKAAERAQALQRQAEEARTARLEAEAELQHAAAERAEGERARAVKDRQQAEDYAQRISRRSHIAIGGCAIAVVAALIAAWLGWQANAAKEEAEQSKNDANYASYHAKQSKIQAIAAKEEAQKRALENRVSELAIKAEELGRYNPDQSLRLALAVHQLDKPEANAKADGILRSANADYAYSHVLRGHKGHVWNAQFSPDGKTAITAGNDDTARLWSVAGGQKLHELKGHTAPIRSARFSPDGKTAITASDDKTARLWNVASSQPLHVLTGHTAPVRSARFSPDGKTAITASDDNTARLWEVDSGNPSHVLRGHESPVLSAHFSPDGKTAITINKNDTARLWNVDNGQLLHTLQGHKRSVLSAQISPDGKTAITTSKDQTARLWNVDSGHLRHELKGHQDWVLSAQFSPDRKTVLTASDDKTVRLWDVNSGELLHILQGHEGSVLDAQFSPDGKTVLTASDDRTVRLWKVNTGELLHILRGHGSWVRSAQFSVDGTTILTASNDKTARLWMLDGNHEPVVLRQPPGGLVGTTLLSPDGKTAITTSKDDETARLWEVNTGELMHTLKDHPGPVLSAQFSCDGKSVITTSKDGTARVWEVNTGELLHTLKDHAGPVLSAQFSCDGKFVITATSDDDNTAHLWNVDSGELLHTLKGHPGPVQSAQFSPDGRFVITTSKDDEPARLWEGNTGKLLHTLNEHTGPVQSARFSPNGNYVITTSQDGTARVWTVEDGKLWDVLQGHDDWVENAQFSPDGKPPLRVITASDDKTARLWDVVSGRELHVLRGHEQWVVSAQFSPDAKTAVTASEDGTARLWDVASGRQLEVLRGDDGALLSAQFSADGNSVLTTSRKGTVQRWHCDSCRPIEETATEVLGRVGRELDEKERKHFSIPDAQPGKN